MCYNVPKKSIASDVKKALSMDHSPFKLKHGKSEGSFQKSNRNFHNLHFTLCRYLILKILQEMLAHGWRNIAAIDISRRETNKSVLIFQQFRPKRCPMMCLSLTDVNKFSLINMPNDLVNIFKRILLNRWSKGIKKEKLMNLSFGSVCQIKLNGWPWHDGLDNDAFHIRSFLCNIIEVFSGHGWKVLMAGDVSANYVKPPKEPGYPNDVHSFWFIYEPTSTQQHTDPSHGFNVLTAPYSVSMSQAPYPAMGASSGYDVPQATAQYTPTAGYGLHPCQTEPPPSYNQATGLNDL